MHTFSVCMMHSPRQSFIHFCIIISIDCFLSHAYTFFKFSSIRPLRTACVGKSLPKGILGWSYTGKFTTPICERTAVIPRGILSTKRGTSGSDSQYNTNLLKWGGGREHLSRLQRAERVQLNALLTLHGLHHGNAACRLGSHARPHWLRPHLTHSLL